MKLSSARSQQVIKNATNGSYYRFERPEKSRIRIRPLECFPNGRLIPKPTDTLVDGDLEVIEVGAWAEGMLVTGKPTHSRATYERELAKRQQELEQLREAYTLLPINGKGTQSRGSWANKIKNCEARIAVLIAGLEEADADAHRIVIRLPAEPTFQARQVVQMSSGLPARVERVRGNMVAVVTRFQGSRMKLDVPAATLRPWEHSTLATL